MTHSIFQENDCWIFLFLLRISVWIEGKLSLCKLSLSVDNDMAILFQIMYASWLLWILWFFNSPMFFLFLLNLGGIENSSMTVFTQRELGLRVDVVYSNIVYMWISCLMISRICRPKRLLTIPHTQCVVLLMELISLVPYHKVSMESLSNCMYTLCSIA